MFYEKKTLTLLTKFSNHHIIYNSLPWVIWELPYGRKLLQRDKLVLKGCGFTEKD